MEIIFFNHKAQSFFESLPVLVRPRARRTFELLEQYGYALGMPHVRALGGGLFELRIVGQAQIRFVYAFHGSKIWILHGFVKKTNRMSSNDLQYARNQHKLLLR